MSERRCPHCGVVLDPELPEITPCPRCKVLLRPKNPYQTPMLIALLLTLIIYFASFGISIYSKSGLVIGSAFGLAFLSGLWLIIMMFKYFKYGD